MLKAIFTTAFLSLFALFFVKAATADLEKQAAAEAALAELQRNIILSDSRRAELKAEVMSLQRDEKSLSRALAQTVKAEQDLNRSLVAGAVRIENLQQQKQTQEQILQHRRAEMAEILAALEKLGFNPPPAVFVQAKDAAQSLHAAALLGALLPQMQDKMQAVQQVLDKLGTLEKEMRTEQQNLNKAQAKREEEQWRLKLLLEEKARQQNEKSHSLAEEEENRQNLAAKARSLQDLLEEIGKQIPPAADTKDQMQIAVKFSSLRRKLSRPVNGKRLTRFGQIVDGKAVQGESFAVSLGASILAPAEGIVRYAGEFRSYGQVLILDVGENYYIILAGLAHIYATPGQFILQGEPVGNMETVLPVNKEGYTIEKTVPELYIEIRKNGKPVDPAGWWANAASVKG